MYDPFASFRISCDWQCHVTRNPPSSGGTDYAIPVGTPIRASFAGVLTNRPPVQYPASGNVAILDRGDGLQFYHLHLSRFVAPGNVAEGDIIGYSGGAAGAPGSGSSTGPHVHVNAYLNNAIRDIHDFFPTTSTAGSTTTPIGEDMPLNAADIVILNQVADSIIQHITGSNPAYDTPANLTLKQIRADLGWLRDTTFKSIQESINSLEPGAAGVVNIQPILDALAALPAATADATRAALKAAL